MIKYLDKFVVMEEIPDEVTLALNITNCQNNCVGCHSPELRANIGTELTIDEIDRLIEENDGISCICFMGEGNDEVMLEILVSHLREKYLYKYKIAIYSGRDEVSDWYWKVFDYIKLGPYKEEFGPLNKETTNQRLYEHRWFSEEKGIFDDELKNRWFDITNKFWKR